MGAALDCKDKQGRGLLHFAAANGRLPVVRHLWSRGAEVDAETPGGWGAWCALSRRDQVMPCCGGDRSRHAVHEQCAMYIRKHWQTLACAAVRRVQRGARRCTWRRWAAMLRWRPSCCR